MKNSLNAEWKPGFRGSAIVAPELAAMELEKLRKKNGEIHPCEVVAAAKSTRNKLHKLFEWDDTEAAIKHREEQARSVLRSIIIERPELKNRKTRMYETQASKSKPRAQSYSTIEEICADPNDRAILLSRALGELVAARLRFSCLQELSIIFRAIDEAQETLRV